VGVRAGEPTSDPTSQRRQTSTGHANDRPGGRPYTPAMRRWVCVIALLFGFAGDSYAWTVRPRMPVPIERPIDVEPARRGLRQSGRWWHTA
jgi:hypothetical protein